MWYLSCNTNIINLFHQICLTLYILDFLNELAVRRLFVFLKNTLNFDYYQDEFIQRKLLSERELKEFILTIHEYFRSEKFLKIIIKKKRCEKFVECMLELPNHDHDHITEKIIDFISNGTEKSTEGNAINVILFSFVLFLND